LTRQIDLFFPLCQPHGGDSPGTLLLHGPAGKGKLFRASVDDHQIRQPREAPALRGEALGLPLRFLLQAVGKAPRENLMHAGKVVGTFHGLDAKTPVLIPCGLPLHHDHHGSHAVRALDVADVVTLHAPRGLREADGPGQVRGRTARPLPLPLGQKLFLAAEGLGVLGGHLDQAGLLPAFRAVQGHPAAAKIRKPGLQGLPVLGIRGNQDRRRG